MKTIQKIALISPNPRFPDFVNTMVGCENTLPLIGTILKNQGYKVEVYMERITPIPWERVLRADLVGFSAVTCSVNRVYEMVQKIKAHRDVPVVLGGPHASIELKFFPVYRQGDLIWLVWFVGYWVIE